MLHTLDEYFLLKEVIKVTGKSMAFYLANFKNEIIVSRHDRYIKKNCIEYRYRNKITDLYNHIPLKDFSNHIGLYRGALEKDIYFMKKYNVEIFPYTELENKIYVIVDDELKEYLKVYTPFIAYSYKDYSDLDIKVWKMFASKIIGFY